MKIKIIGKHHGAGQTVIHANTPESAKGFLKENGTFKRIKIELTFNQGESPSDTISLVNDLTPHLR